MVPRMLAALIMMASLAAAQDAEVKKVLETYQSLKPSVKDLAWYQLDWVSSLKEAKEKAAREKRPICALVCINTYGNMFTGHC